MPAISRPWVAPTLDMCLILFAWQSHPRYSLVVAANRDEFHQRPSAPAGFWDDCPGYPGRPGPAGRRHLAGRHALGAFCRDHQLPRTGSPRTAARTVTRAPGPGLPGCRLARHSNMHEAWPRPARPTGDTTCCSPIQAQWCTFPTGTMKFVVVADGAHGSEQPPAGYRLAQGSIPVASACRVCCKMSKWRLIDLFDLLTDKTLTPGEIPEDLKSRLAPEQLMKHYFIVSPVYGTRCSTVVLMGRDGSAQFHERQFDPAGTGDR